jgi:hypothetical protein
MACTPPVSHQAPHLPSSGDWIDELAQEILTTRVLPNISEENLHRLQQETFPEHVMKKVFAETEKITKKGREIFGSTETREVLSSPACKEFYAKALLRVVEVMLGEEHHITSTLQVF